MCPLGKEGWPVRGPGSSGLVWALEPLSIGSLHAYLLAVFNELCTHPTQPQTLP